MMELAGLTPMAAICEMLGEDCSSRGIKDAQLFAEEQGLVFIEGKETIDWYLEHVDVPVLF
jgi:3,4-dihydroxy 2-butanone 4-phosphate synthase